MSKPSGLLQRQRQAEKYMLDLGERITRQIMLDTLQITMHYEFGWGYDRIMQLTKAWSENYNFYHGALTGGVEADYRQEKLDQLLSGILGKRQELIPFKARYPEVREITYEPKGKKQ